MANELTKAPNKVKDDNVKQDGYDQQDFTPEYWTTNGECGSRMDRKAGQAIALIRGLAAYNILSSVPIVVDIGAGAGSYVADIRANGYKCDGCEFSASGRDLAREKFGIDLAECDLRDKIHLPSRSYDFAFCVGVLTMIPERFLAHALGEIHRIMSPYGVLLANLQNPDGTQIEPHLTSLPHLTWLSYFERCKFKDITSTCQPGKFGIGVANEFCGLFQKVKP